jgi:hypothetical protein
LRTRPLLADIQKAIRCFGDRAGRLRDQNELRKTRALRDHRA